MSLRDRNLKILKNRNIICIDFGAINTFKMPVPGGMYQTQGPSCFDKMKMGFMIGFCVGMASGGLFGGFTALRYGARGRELVHSVGKVMLQGGGTFGTFMAIGTGIRC